MSAFQAIAGVSATLRNLLRDRMEMPSSVTVAAPDVSVAGVTGRRVNLYLYQVTESPHLKNQEIVGQGHPGAYGHPPLSLDLHYLLTTHAANDEAADADLEAQQLLGDAMRVLHDFPVLTDALHEDDDPLLPTLMDPSLLGSAERVKVTLQPNSLDETSKIWSSLPEASFRRSVAYAASVVQIESLRPRRSALPVRERRIYAVPLQTPRVESIERDPPFPGLLGPVAEVGDTIVLRGHSLRGPGTTRVNVGDQSVAPAAPRADRIDLPVPAALRAGAHAVQVIQELLLDAAPGDPPVPHRGFQSNALPLLVIPRFVSAVPSPAAAGELVTVTVSPPVGAAQKAVLLLGDFSVQAEPMAHDALPSAVLEFRLPEGLQAVPPATYLARVRVDGAESRLTVDPVTTAYDGPTFTVS